MSDLNSFRRDAPPKQRTTGRITDWKNAPRGTPKPPPDKDRCPAGWDSDTWHLVLLFEQYARADRIDLAAGRPVIYAELNDLVSRFALREHAKAGKFHQEIHGCTRRELGEDLAARCWYHWPPHLDRVGEQEARDLT